jgi:hypothetical protein
MPVAGFEPTIPVFKRAKTFHALDRAAAVTCMQKYLLNIKCVFDFSPQLLSEICFAPINI